MPNRLKVLISAYACEPEKGSEPGIGWNWVRQIARFHETRVVTRANNRATIEQALTREPMPNVHWVYFDLPNWLRFWKKGQRGVHFYYYLWQSGAYLVGRRLHRELGFDLVHHVTFVNYWMPSFLALLSVPFIWGPVGGGESAPRVFYQEFGLRGRIYEVARDFARWMASHDPCTRLTARRARIALATTEETAQALRQLGATVVEVYSQVGIPADDLVRLSSIPLRSGSPLRFVSIGRLLHLKGFSLGLKAFSLFQKECANSEYWLVGNGPDRRRLESLVNRLSIGDKVKFWGHLPRAQVLERLAECDVLVHPSLHDSGGLVCAEAMAAGRPVICLDLGGPGLQVTEETGIKVPALSPGQVVMDLAGAMKCLAEDPALKQRMSDAGRMRVQEHFSWDRKGDYLTELYYKVAGQ